jgi:hypothetical protein
MAMARRLLWITTVISLFVIVAVVGPPLVSRLVDEIRDRTESHVALIPASTLASSARPGAPAKHIADGHTNRYWSPAGPAIGSSVEVEFNRPVRVLDIIVTPGISTDQAQFLTVGRPAELLVQFVTPDGAVTEETIKLRDQAGGQRFTVEARNVQRVKLVIRSAYAPKGQSKVAIGEVEFFGRS